MDKRDVIVIGGGIFGLSCAYACAGRGLSVRLVEAAQIASGASGGIVGALSPHVPDAWNPKKAFQFEALMMAEGFWARIADHGDPGYRRNGRLMPILSENALIHAKARQQSAPELWRGHAEWRVYPADHAPDLLSPQAAPFGIVHDTLAAHLFPIAACQALASAAVARGVEIVENWPVAGVLPGRVVGPSEIQADTIIVAAGVPGFDLVAPGREIGTGVKGQSALLDTVLPSTKPTLFADGVYVVPHGQRGTAVGSTSENDWSDLGTTDDLLEEVTERARRLCPAIRNAKVLTRWAGLRPKARRRDPLLGPVPDMPGVLAALGGFKIGFGLAPLVGEKLADFAEDKAPDLPPSSTFAHHVEGML
ncbi:NAD(P)/FAD-dependent oxidoreductase [Halovulum sp. GXIMD14793]